MALDIGNKKLIQKAIDGMYDICTRVIVVGGYKVDVICNICKVYPKVEVFYNESFMHGMFSSVQEGIRHIHEEKFFLIPGDYPLVNKAVYDKMKNCAGEIVIPTYRGRKGHPVLIESRLIKEILEEPYSSNLKHFISQHKYELLEVEEKGVLIDIDTIEDYNKVTGFITGG